MSVVELLVDGIGECVVHFLNGAIIVSKITLDISAESVTKAIHTSVGMVQL